MKNIALTYKITKYLNENGIDIECLDWEDVVTCCYQDKDIFKYAVDCTKIYLKDYVNNTLDKKQMPKIISHPILKQNEFQITYDLKTLKPIDIRTPYKTKISNRVAGLTDALG